MIDSSSWAVFEAGFPPEDIVFDPNVFAVTAAAFKAAQDDYSAILLQALGDRLAEAFAEHLHERVRKDIWGYASGEALSNEELIAEKYSGNRLTESFATGYVSSDYEDVFAFSLLVLILIFKPSGLLGKAEIQKV